MNRLARNPFYVLGVPPMASAVEVEREGRKLLGMLELGLASARHYLCPLGKRERTPEMVREAMAELRDPQKRLLCELWARLEPRADEESADAEYDEHDEYRERSEDDEDDDDGEDADFMEEDEQGFDDDEPAAAGPWSDAGAALGWRRA